MFKKLLAVSFTLLFSNLAVAGAANLSITTITGNGSSYGQSFSSDSYSEGAVGWRHLNASEAGNTSWRNEQYVRGSYSLDTDLSTTWSSFSLSGTIVNATRIGESDIDINTHSITTGTSTHVGVYTEIGTFQAYDQVDDSSSYETGAYVASGYDVGYTNHYSHVDAVTDAYSAYGIYGAN